MSDPLKQIKVLYVEDDEAIREPLVRFLKRRVGMLEVALDGQEGLEKFSSFNPDIIVSDIKMPRMNGLEMVEQIRKYDPELPIIITTAHSESGYLLDAIKLNVHNYNLKPIDTTLLQKTLTNMAEQILLQREKEKNIQILKNVLDAHQDIMLVYEKNKVIYENDKFLEFFDVTNIEEFRENYTSLFDQFVEQDNYFSKAKVNEDEDPLSILISLSSLDRVVLMKDAKDNLIKRFLVNITKLGDEKFLLSLTDVTSLDKEKAKYQYKAFTDKLTGAINKSKFDQILDDYIIANKTLHKEFSLIMFDIDHFKKVNDTYGHLVGDNVLKTLTKIAKKKIRQNDILARWGGEEFMIILDDANCEIARKVAEHLRESIEANVFDEIDKLTCSFGVAQYQGEDKKTFLQKVDKLLYVAKNKGRNQVVFDCS
jgi:diguanylate cyclase (GGDEF)-like protein